MVALLVVLMEHFNTGGTNETKHPAAVDSLRAYRER